MTNIAKNCSKAIYLKGMKIYNKSKGFWNVVLLHDTMSLNEARNLLSKYFYITAIYVPAKTEAYKTFVTDGMSYYFRIKGHLKNEVLIELQEQKPY